MAQPQNTIDTSRASKKRCSPDLPFFTPSAESFNPRPYYPLSCSSVPRIYRTMVSYNREACPKPFDPTPDDPTAIFIHPPFNEFPDAHLHPEGLTYTLLAENPDWFLDPNDFKSESDPNPNAIVYPTCLEPPRGWCPTKKKDIKVRRLDGCFDEDTPMLRCTFCRRKYAGVNAKSMWRRHVLEKHKIPMSNRRDGPSDNGRSGRTANKENKKIQSSAMNYLNSFQRAKNDALDGPATSPPSLLPPFGGVARNLRPAQSRLRELYPTGDNDATDLTVSPLSTSSQREDIMRPDHAHESPQFQGLMLPPSSPPVNISSSLKSAPQASPFDPLKTPNIGHALRQPWKFPSPSHPLHVGPDELCLGVPVRGIAGEGLKGGYIPNHSSPFSLPHTSPTKLFSSPSVDASPLSRKFVTGRILGWKRSSSDSLKFSLPEFPLPEIRRPTYTGPLPVPTSERFEFETPELLTDADDFDSSFSSLNDSFMSWIDMNSAFGTPSHDGAKIVESSSSSFPDTPIKRSTSTTIDARTQTTLKDESTIWAPRPSGIGLGISVPSSDIDVKKEVGDGFQDLEEFIYPVTTPADSPNTDDGWGDPRGPCAPPLKRRKTM